VGTKSHRKSDAMNELFSIMKTQSPGTSRWSFGTASNGAPTYVQHFYVMVPVADFHGETFGRMVAICRWSPGAEYIGPPMFESSEEDPYCKSCVDVQLQYLLHCS
jgi:hypothetical protein